MAIHPTRIFKKADELEKAWNEYKSFLLTEAEKWPKIQYVGKDGSRMVDYPVLPYTLEGFKRYCRTKYGEIEQYFYNKDNLYTNFVGICSHIKEEIREHQITGGMMGFFNPSITQRLNGLAEKTEVEQKTIIVKTSEDDE